MSVDPSVQSVIVPSTTTTTGTNAVPTMTGNTVTIPAVLRQPATEPAGRMFSEQEVERFRQQERDKLYGRLNEQTETLKSVQDKLAALEAERQAKADEAAKAQAEAEAAAKAKAEAEMSAKDYAREQTETLRRQLEEMERQRAEERALYEKDRAFLELRQYAQSQIDANRDNIAPELIDLVNGNTREEIDASIKLLTEKSAAIAQTVAERTAQARQASLRGVSPTGRPPTGPLDTDTSQRTLSPQDISSMSMQEYAQYRQHLLAAATNKVRSSGLYG